MPSQSFLSIVFCIIVTVSCNYKSIEAVSILKSSIFTNKSWKNSYLFSLRGGSDVIPELDGNQTVLSSFTSPMGFTEFDEPDSNSSSESQENTTESAQNEPEIQEYQQNAQSGFLGFQGFQNLRNYIQVKFIAVFFKQLLSFVVSDPDLLDFGVNVCMWLFWACMSLSLLGTVGLDTKPVLALVSVVSLTFGLAAKDILMNTFSGLYILFSRPFKRNAIIKVNGMKGRVIAMNIHYVKLRSLNDRSEILIPLSAVYGSAIEIDYQK